MKRIISSQWNNDTKTECCLWPNHFLAHPIISTFIITHSLLADCRHAVFYHLRRHWITMVVHSDHIALGRWSEFYGGPHPVTFHAPTLLQGRCWCTRVTNKQWTSAPLCTSNDIWPCGWCNLIFGKSCSSANLRKCTHKHTMTGVAAVLCSLCASHPGRNIDSFQLMIVIT